MSLEQTLQNLTSPKRGHTFWGLVGVCALAFVLLWLKHGSWLSRPNDIMFGYFIDGYKNYMTSAWHVGRDSSFTHYGGMNYPYGEHTLFTDNQPIVTSAMQWWHRNVFPIADKTVGILNLLQALSMVFGVAIFYLLMRKLHAPFWYAGMTALGVIFLTPQYGRFEVHFSLSHSWVIPLLLYWLCRYEERFSRRYQSLHIGMLVWVTSQIHFYYFGLCALFLLFYTTYHVWVMPTRQNIRSRFNHLIVMLALPFAALNVWLHWSDFVNDRPEHPNGYFEYLSEWQGIFLPYRDFPLFKVINAAVPVREVNGESVSYVGLCVGLFTLYALFTRFRYLDTSWNTMAYHRVHKHYLRGIFFAGCCLLAFSFGLPFILPGFEGLLDYTGPLRQFRSLARFSWAYYYVGSVLAFYVLWNKSVRFKGLKDGKFPWLGRAAIAAGLTIVCYEAFQWQWNKQHKTMPNFARREVFAPEEKHWINKVNFSKYQAVLSLKYFHVGSENVTIDPDPPMFRKSLATAYHTGVPDMGVNLSRTSLRQTLRSIQLLGAPLQSPRILEDLPDDRPIALLVEPAHWQDLEKKYGHLLRKSVPVYEHPQMKVFALYPDSLRRVSREYVRELTSEINTRPLEQKGKWRITPTDLPFFYTDFNGLNTDKPFFQGGGAWKGMQNDTLTLFHQKLPRGDYYLSFWIDAGEDMALMQELTLRQGDRTAGFRIGEHVGAVFDEWALIDIPLSSVDSEQPLQLFLFKKGVNLPITVDEVLLKPAGATMYRREKNWVVRNNYWFEYE